MLENVSIPGPTNYSTCTPFLSKEARIFKTNSVVIAKIARLDFNIETKNNKKKSNLFSNWLPYFRDFWTTPPILSRDELLTQNIMYLKKSGNNCLVLSSHANNIFKKPKERSFQF